MSAGWRSVRPMRHRSEHKVEGRDVRGRPLIIILDNDTYYKQTRNMDVILYFIICTYYKCAESDARRVTVQQIENIILIGKLYFSHCVGPTTILHVMLDDKFIIMWTTDCYVLLVSIRYC